MRAIAVLPISGGPVRTTKRCRAAPRRRARRRGSPRTPAPGRPPQRGRASSGPRRRRPPAVAGSTTPSTAGSASRTSARASTAAPSWAGPSTATRSAASPCAAAPLRLARHRVRAEHDHRRGRRVRLGVLRRGRWRSLPPAAEARQDQRRPGQGARHERRSEPVRRQGPAQAVGLPGPGVRPHAGAALEQHVAEPLELQPAERLEVVDGAIRGHARIVAPIGRAQPPRSAA